MFPYLTKITSSVKEFRLSQRLNLKNRHIYIICVIIIFENGRYSVKHDLFYMIFELILDYLSFICLLS